MQRKRELIAKKKKAEQDLDDMFMKDILGMGPKQGDDGDSKKQGLLKLSGSKTDHISDEAS